MDPKMPSFTKGKWAEIVNAYGMKYRGIIEWQRNNIVQVPLDNGYLYDAMGRKYKVSMEESKKYKGTWVYKETYIKNCLVQGMATANIMPLAMTMVQDRMNDSPKQFMSTNHMGQVHDSMVFDTMSHEVKRLAYTCIQVFEDLPKMINKLWGLDFNVPLTGDFTWGPNYADQTHSVKHEGDKWILEGK